MKTEPEGWAWPDFGEPELIDRLLMPQPDFHDLWLNMMSQMPSRPFTAEVFENGTGYPWPRPDGSFVLAEGEGRLLADLETVERAALIEEFTGKDRGRTPMLAIGSNASPVGLWRKFGHFDDPADRTLLAIAGRIHDFDVGATAELALYGALPATIFPSRGTRASAMAVWLTDTQLTQLAWAEIPYWIGRLDTRFEFEPAVADTGPGGFDHALVFVNRFGAFGPDGHPLALAAIPAENRTVPALSQVQLLELTAEMTFGPGISPEELVRRAFENPDQTGPKVTGIMRSNSIPFESDRWTPYPGPGT
ncbi:MAG: hypothetical protein KDB66_11790 [Solirubrobacterales bacterium]|nr:hypothetical protein [Solirubrobacterales bacterium]MCB8915742.1 hypothetical protein [Thermoleophilales bacterium]